MPFKFVHAADVHLDSPMRGLERYEGAPVAELRGATRQAFENLIELCISEDVAFLVLAGDLYDGDWRDYSTGLFFARQMKRLVDAGIGCYVLHGNHDAQSVITKRLPEISGVHVFDSKRSKVPVIDEELGVALHGRSYPKRHVTDEAFVGSYTEAVDGLFNIGVLHTALDGSLGHAPYAPCDVNTLVQKGYQYRALGHVHARREVATDPWIVFPGNLQGRHANEPGAKGCYLIEVEDGAIVGTPEFRALDVVRWGRIRCSLDEASDLEDAVGLVSADFQQRFDEADGRMLALRLELVGSTPAYAALTADEAQTDGAIRQAAIAIGGDELWIERIDLHELSPPLDLEALATRDDLLGALLRDMSAIEADEDRIRKLAEGLDDICKKLPREAGAVTEEAGTPFDLGHPDWLRERLQEARSLLASRLVAEGGS